MASDLHDPVYLLDRIDAAGHELRSWLLFLTTWKAMGFAYEGDALAPFVGHGTRLDVIREKISGLRTRKGVSDQLFKEVLDAIESQKKLERAFWELASRFWEEHGLGRGGWGLPPTWK